MNAKKHLISFLTFMVIAITSTFFVPSSVQASEIGVSKETAMQVADRGHHGKYRHGNWGNYNRWNRPYYSYYNYGYPGYYSGYYGYPSYYYSYPSYYYGSPYYYNSYSNPYYYGGSGVYLRFGF